MKNTLITIGRLIFTLFGLDVTLSVFVLPLLIAVLLVLIIFKGFV